MAVEIRVEKVHTELQKVEETLCLTELGEL